MLVVRESACSSACWSVAVGVGVLVGSNVPVGVAVAVGVDVASACWSASAWRCWWRWALPSRSACAWPCWSPWCRGRAWVASCVRVGVRRRVVAWVRRCSCVGVWWPWVGVDVAVGVIVGVLVGVGVGVMVGVGVGVGRSAVRSRRTEIPSLQVAVCSASKLSTVKLTVSPRAQPSLTPMVAGSSPGILRKYQDSVPEIVVSVDLYWTPPHRAVTTVPAGTLALSTFTVP